MGQWLRRAATEATRHETSTERRLLLSLRGSEELGYAAVSPHALVVAEQ